MSAEEKLAPSSLWCKHPSGSQGSVAISCYPKKQKQRDEPGAT